MTAIPPPRQAGSDQRPTEDTPSWRGTIDGWVKDQKIRRDALIAVGMLLVAVIVIVWIIFRSGDSALTSMLSMAIGKLILGSIPVVIATIGGWRVLQRRRRHRDPTPPPQLGTVPMTPAQDSAGGQRPAESPAA
ncbi:MAG TPA: hypothetical protein VFO16_07415 [Pseudonocardiaceae bacterium]|nr:hypothetical protein [Pseudonocardiaceae bacterium]